MFDIYNCYGGITMGSRDMMDYVVVCSGIL